MAENTKDQWTDDENADTKLTQTGEVLIAAKLNPPDRAADQPAVDSFTK